MIKRWIIKEADNGFVMIKIKNDENGTSDYEVCRVFEDELERKTKCHEIHKIEPFIRMVEEMKDDMNVYSTNYELEIKSVADK